MSRGTSLRRITVEGTRYAWILARVDPHYVVVRVWAAARGRRDHPLEVRLRHDDPWLNFGPIITASPEGVKATFQLEPVTPAVVRRAIEAAVAAGWGPHHPPEPRLFEMSPDGVLKPTDDPRRVDENPWADDAGEG
jgi:hypothetical protein